MRGEEEHLHREGAEGNERREEGREESSIERESEGRREGGREGESRITCLTSIQPHCSFHTKI